MLDKVEEEFQPLNLDARFMSIRFTENNRPVRDLWDIYIGKQLVLSPEFQRNYVWDKTKASRYIESLLLDLPVPAIFLSDEEDGTEEVIDGQQRLMSIFKFLSPLSRNQNGKAASTSLEPLTLVGLEVLSNLNGKNVLALSIPDRSKVWDRLVKTLSLPTDVHPDMKFELFARLNLGSLTLNPQELRNCIFRGPYNSMITELSTNHTFLDMWGKSTPDKRMAHREYVLRFFAFLHRRETYATSQKSFLNSEMKANQKMIDPKWKTEFNLAIKWVERIFGGEAFRRFTPGNEDNPAGRWVHRKSVQLFELEMVSFAEMGDRLNEIWEPFHAEKRQMFRDAARRQLATVMSESKFADTLTDATTRPDKVRYRFDKWISALADFVTDPDEYLDGMRKIYERLQESELCAVCPSKMNSEDAIWRTSVEGRQLVHRYCAS